MEMPACSSEVFRIPKSKRFPKGLRVRVALNQPGVPVGMGTLVVAVRDGHQFYTREPLTPEVTVK